MTAHSWGHRTRRWPRALRTVTGQGPVSAPIAVGDQVDLALADGRPRGGVVAAIRHSPMPFVEVEVSGSRTRVPIPMSQVWT